jgi:anti-anti-sigma factor
MSAGTDYKVLCPSGILTLTTSKQLVEEFKVCLDAKIRTVLIDLKDVDFIDSSALGTLVSCHTRLKLAGGKLYLCSLKDQIRNLFDISDMDRVFETFSDQEEFYAKVVNRDQFASPQ